MSYRQALGQTSLDIIVPPGTDEAHTSLGKESHQ